MSDTGEIMRLTKIITTQGKELMRYQGIPILETDERILLMEMRLLGIAEKAEEYKASRDYWMCRCEMFDEKMQDTSQQLADALCRQVEAYRVRIEQLERSIEQCSTHETSTGENL